MRFEILKNMSEILQNNVCKELQSFKAPNDLLRWIRILSPNRSPISSVYVEVFHIARVQLECLPTRLRLVFRQMRRILPIPPNVLDDNRVFPVDVRNDEVRRGFRQARSGLVGRRRELP